MPWNLQEGLRLRLKGLMKQIFDPDNFWIAFWVSKQITNYQTNDKLVAFEAYVTYTKRQKFGKKVCGRFCWLPERLTLRNAEEKAEIKNFFQGCKGKKGFEMAKRSTIHSSGNQFT